MSSITQFPFPSGTAPEPQVVEWLDEAIDPKKYQTSQDEKRLARVRVQGRIRYTRKIKKAPPTAEVGKRLHQRLSVLWLSRLTKKMGSTYIENI